jgi:hypothetical protein
MAKKPTQTPPSDKGDVCGQCRHFEPDDDGDGTCYESPPLAHLDGEGHLYALRPPVGADCRACSRFQQRLTS